MAFDGDWLDTCLDRTFHCDCHGEQGMDKHRVDTRETHLGFESANLKAFYEFYRQDSVVWVTKTIAGCSTETSRILLASIAAVVAQAQCR